LVFKRAGDATGKLAGVFLLGLTVFRWVLGGMMADASLETMDLIRSLDTEKLDIADISDLISSYLNHLAWMFNSVTIGVLLINGHTAYIINWLESKLKNFTVGKTVGSIGGSKV
jgi:ABC-type Na+ efflux pump permease subunit